MGVALVGGIDVLIRFCLISSFPFPLTQNAPNQPVLWSLLTNGLNILKQKAPCRSVSNVCNHSKYRLRPHSALGGCSVRVSLTLHFVHP